ncbi:RmlC-like cupin domain-containing protein [Dactylonectria estremocensis]|uniref:RmlC-like cupin domain-containing protein n=1 Tax=Dactylonectria estremocensis TaxID=1079267 RepID=A0A9P9F1W8_9HYPO|nr:RmlC-like cupin domain-containing protein [Dactylonectria estremocensis]
MKYPSMLSASLALSWATHFVAAAPQAAELQKRDAKFDQGIPDNGKGKGGPILGGTNKELDLQNPDNLGQQPTDNGVVPNLKWSFSDSKTRILKGGWVREQVIQDLPSSHDISGAQQHLRKGAIRELHWHRVAEWGIVYSGSVRISAVDELGRYQVEDLSYGDIWYFPKGAAHTIQGLGEENEYLLVFDDADFDKAGTTFMVDDWINHTPKHILAKNFGVDPEVFENVTSPNPYILPSEVSKKNVTDGPAGTLDGDSSFVYRTLQHEPEKIGGTGGEFYKIDSTNFPVSKTLAATFVTLKPGGLRELHWHPNAEEWLYFHKGTGRATVFIGNAAARTFDFSAGDTAAFPDNSGHYIENTSETEDLVWIEVYKSERVADISLTQWLALTPADIVAQTLNVSISFVESLKKEKQVLIA